MSEVTTGKDKEIEVHIAPMIDVSNRYFRMFHRLLSKRAIVWTEMIKDDALLYNAADKRKLEWLLGKDDEESPVVFQLGGNEPEKLAAAAEMVEQAGYSEVNLNVGCPSNRVAGKGEFGACLMLKPELVRDCVHAMQRRVQIPVSVKTRLGVDSHDTPAFTQKFVNVVSTSGCRRFYMHARKALLAGLSPAQNRTIPPLDYDRVKWLCSERPDLLFVLNGGLTTLGEGIAELQHSPSNLVGVMYGRAALNTPAIFSEVDDRFFGDEAREVLNRRQLLDAYCHYLDRIVRLPCIPKSDPKLLMQQQGAPVCIEGCDDATMPGGGMTLPGTRLNAMKPAVNLFTGFPGSRLVATHVERHVRSPTDRHRGPADILRDAVCAVEAKFSQVLDHPLQFPPTTYELKQFAKQEFAHSDAHDAENIPAT
ncbi:tRNA-dihydrouridine(20/20a) synthase [Diplonema papillatum]|nr:tRNA-dihydrouridine(20/20a) synthase [Diplonema papillatum]KAJ9445625.1 tRNA-dihydrouridine(20/20a) synthase [Diplonema papillatum]